MPTADSQFDPGPSPTSTIYLFKGNTLYFFNNPTPGNNTGTAVTPAGQSAGFNQTINNNVPTPVPLHGAPPGQLSVFVGGNDGYIYRYDVVRSPLNGQISFPHGDGATPSNVSPTWKTYVGRLDAKGAALCPGYDSVTAAPVVQLYAYSNSAFRTAFNDDIVYVITRYSGPNPAPNGNNCSASTQNRVYALLASTGTILTGPHWPINVTGTSVLLDYGSETCTLHYANDDSGPVDPINNTLYCTSNLAGGAPVYQHSMHAFNSITGVKNWGSNLGAVVTRPQIRNSRVYVLNSAGALWALDPNNLGARLWSSGSIQVTAGGALGTKNPWAEPRLAGGLNGLVLAVGVGGTDNQLHAVVDNGTSAAIAWNTTLGANVTSIPALSNLLGKVYVGLGDSTVHQLDINHVVNGAPADEAHAVLGGGGGNTYDVALDVVGSAATDINSLTVANGSNLRRFCVPWTSGSLGTSSIGTGGDLEPQACPPAGQTCTLSACVNGKTDGACHCINPTPVPDGTSCTTGNETTCLPTGTCSNGTCHDVPAQDGTACNDGITCTTPDVCKSGQCVSTPTNGCPGLGQACNPLTLPCSNGYLCCGGVCKDGQNDHANCGACSNPCVDYNNDIFVPNSSYCHLGECRRQEAVLCPSFVDASTLNTLNGGQTLQMADALIYTSQQRLDSKFGMCSAFFADYYDFTSATGNGAIESVNSSNALVTRFDFPPQSGSYYAHGVDFADFTPDHIVAGSFVDDDVQTGGGDTQTILSNSFWIDESGTAPATGMITKAPPSTTGDTGITCTTNADCSAYPGTLCQGSLDYNCGSVNHCVGPLDHVEWDIGATGPTMSWDSNNQGFTLSNNLVQYFFWEANWATNGDVAYLQRTCTSPGTCSLSVVSTLPGWPPNPTHIGSMAGAVSDFCYGAGVGSCSVDADCTAFGRNLVCGQGNWSAPNNRCYPKMPLTYPNGTQQRVAKMVEVSHGGNNVAAPYLFIAVGTWLFQYRPGGFNDCYVDGAWDLSRAWTPDVAKGEAAVAQIVDLTQDWFYWDVYVDVRDANGKYETLVLKRSDYSFHNLGDVHTELNLKAGTIAFPAPNVFGAEPRDSADSGAYLIRIEDPGGPLLTAQQMNGTQGCVSWNGTLIFQQKPTRFDKYNLLP